MVVCTVLAISTSFEFLLLVTLFVIFVCAYPDTYRSALWAEGARHGWNSDPQQRVYDFANYRPLKEIPLIWNQQLTDSNLATAVIALVAWAAKWTWRYQGYRFEGVTFLYNVLLCGLWVYAVVSQSSSDVTDVDHLSFRPWYLVKSCGVAEASVRKFCVCAKLSFGLTVLASVFFGLKACATIIEQAYLCGLRRGLGMRSQENRMPLELNSRL